ncbi:ferredoxin family protein [bacterium]|nr:ferredoxin family protein [bacterium]
MAYVVGEPCVKCKYTDCVKACPVDAFREGVNTLVIDPATCIDCDACVPVCPTQAITSGTATPAGWDLAEWKEYNAFYANLWPVISKGKEPMEGADDVAQEKGKLAAFDPSPFTG